MIFAYDLFTTLWHLISLCNVLQNKDYARMLQNDAHLIQLKDIPRKVYSLMQVSIKNAFNPLNTP